MIPKITQLCTPTFHDNGNGSNCNNIVMCKNAPSHCAVVLSKCKTEGSE